MPLDLMGMVVPRERWMNEGTSLHATRIDPSWYGRLLVTFTNLDRHDVTLGRGNRFCTVYFERVTPPLERRLTRRDVPAPRRRFIGAISFEHARPEELLSPEQVTEEDI